jgi:hypothetical protein
MDGEASGPMASARICCWRCSACWLTSSGVMRPSLEETNSRDAAAWQCQDTPLRIGHEIGGLTMSLGSLAEHPKSTSTVSPWSDVESIQVSSSGIVDVPRLMALCVSIKQTQFRRNESRSEQSPRDRTHSLIAS